MHHHLDVFRSIIVATSFILIVVTRQSNASAVEIPSAAALIAGEMPITQVDWTSDDDLPTTPWRITLGLGAAFSDTSTRSVSANFNASLVREDQMSKWDTSLKYIYSYESGDIDDNFGLVESSYLRRFESESPWGWFGQASFQYNATEPYRTRTKAFGGLFYLLSETDSLKLAGKGGVGGTRDSRGNTDVVPRTLAGWTLDWRINSLVTVTSSGSIENDIGALEDYLLVGQVRFNIAISEVRNLALYLTIRDEYDSNPQPGNSWNQIWITTGLNFTF